MKFVSKDLGMTSENSSGGGTEGLLMEVLYMFLAYWGMIAFLVVGGFITAAALAYLWVNVM